MWILTTEGMLDEKGRAVDTPFGGRLVHHGAQQGDKIAVIVDRSEIWVYDHTWTQLVHTQWQLNCLLWYGDQLLVGTEKARLAWVTEDLEFIDSFDQIDGRSRWSTPWGGPPDVRSLATSDGLIFANIHVGWIARSKDGGRSWVSLTEGLHKDVHQVSCITASPATVLAATAGGFHLSTDQGDHFEKHWDDHPTYQRAVTGINTSTFLVSVSSGPGGSRSRLMRTQDRGETWNEVAGLPRPIDTNINTYQLFLDPTGEGTVIIDNASIYSTDDGGETWKLVLDDLPKTYQVLMGP